jgi:hypothetical protein
MAVGAPVDGFVLIRAALAIFSWDGIMDAGGFKEPSRPLFPHETDH